MLFFLDVKSFCQTNLTGQIDLEEFLLLWAEIKTWKYVFQKYEHERKGIVRAYSFREMLNSTGYHVSNRVYHVLSHRYIDSKNSCIHFEDFLYCLANMKSAYDNITVHPTNSKGQLIFTPEDFLRLSLST
ncbi:unnamed protein product [Heterobilharzia americana]|nr:unnamed protein product [Heterobilharzia americana]